MDQRHRAFARKIEYLGAADGIDRVTNQAIVVVTVRLDPDETFRPANLVLSTAQAERLRDDLVRLLGSTSPVQS